MPSKPRKNYEPEFKSKVVKCAEELNNNSEAARRFGVNEKLVRDWRKKDMLSKTKPEHEEELARQGEEHVYMGYSIAQPAESEQFLGKVCVRHSDKEASQPDLGS